MDNYYRSLINKEDPEDPIKRQCGPLQGEPLLLDYEKKDPLDESRFNPLPRLIHRYPDRVLLLTTDKCAMYCSHCFRQYFTASGQGEITEKELVDCLAYISEHKEIKEILLSGGDPLTLSPEKISTLLEKIRSIRPDLVIRLGTRIPVTDPGVITEKLSRIIASVPPLWVLTQYNHPREITRESVNAIEKLINKGVPILNQSVLLRGVNNSVVVLKELCEKLIRHRIKPYYLIQGDLAAGTSSFRVPLYEGWNIVKELRKNISGIAMPTFTVDLPDGGGKIPLTENYFTGEESINGRKWLLFENLHGEKYKYPLEK